MSQTWKSVLPLPDQPILELCVETRAGVAAAVTAQADRIELCSSLEEDGLTSDLDLLRHAREVFPGSISAMLRPRPGPFLVPIEDLLLVLDQARSLVAGGADALVFGPLLPGELEIDIAALELLAEALPGVPRVFHRAFDLLPDLPAALEQLVNLGVKRILTSGAATTAEAGVEVLADLVQQAAGRIEIIVAGKVRPHNIATLHAKIAAPAYHSAKYAK